MNRFVDFIRQFYSQSAASSDAAYAERSTKNLKGIKLKISRLVTDIKNDKVEALILTGNAGDGKTFLCKQIYVKLTGKDFPNREISIEKIGNKTFRFIKDASEVNEEKLKEVIDILEKKISPQLPENERSRLSREVIIIAGNEGKLSQLFERSSPLSGLLMKALRVDFHDIEEESDSEPPDLAVKIINFNWRALVGEEAFESILNAFLNEDEWKTCDNCDYSGECPIFFNARTMKESVVQERLKILFKFMHYLEGHFTMRELFSALAYIITADRNCTQIRELLQGDKNDDDSVPLANYIFYNNVFTIDAGPNELEDKILKEIRKYDVAYAPMPVLNNPLFEYIKDMETYLGTEDEKKVFADLVHIKEFSKPGASQPDARVYDYLKRRIYFLPLNYEGAWPGLFVDEKEISGPMASIQPENFLPFKGFKSFDEFMTRPKEDAEVFKLKIIKGLNVMVNRHDPECEFFLKAYKPQRRGQTYNLEIRNELVEDREVTLRVESPRLGVEYLEFLPRRLSLAVNVDESGEIDETPLSLAIDLEMYELLHATINGNQARHSFREILGIIDDFREAFYYRLLKRIDKPKFGLDTAHKSKGEAIEIAAKDTEIRIKQV